MSSRRGHACPYCGNFLVPRVAKGGQVPDSEFVRCANQHPPYFYRYPPPGTTPAFPPAMHAPGAPLHPSLQTIPTPTPAFPAQSLSLAAVKSQCKGLTSDGHPCKSGRIDRGCPRQMCRKHCVAAGPCTLNSHERHRTNKDSTKPYARVSAAPSSALVSSGTSVASTADDSLWAQWDKSFENISAGVTLPLRTLEESSRRGRERVAAEERQFEMDIGYRLSPELSVEEELARMEEDNLSHALRLSATDHHTATISTLFPSSPPPTPATSSSRLRLRSLSASPDLPQSVAALLAAAQVFVPSPPPAACAKLPRRQQWQPAASVANKRRPQARPTITTQLNETWMSNSTSPATAAPSPTLSSSSAVFHVRNGGGRRAFMDRTQAERFTLIFFTGAEPRVLSVDVSRINSPRWPTYILSADDKTIADLGSELKDDEGFPITQLDLYLHRQRTWMGIDHDYPHTVSTGAVMFLRRRGVHGPQDQATLDKFLPDTAPAHLRYNLPRERAAIRDALKDVIVINSDSDGEKKRKGKSKRRATSSRTDNVVLVSPRRPRLSVKTSGLVVPRSSTTTSSTTSPPPSALFLRSASTASSASEPGTPSLDAMLRLPAKDKPWPFGLYTVDVVAGFLEIDSTKGFLPDRFHAAFDPPGKTVEFKPATYHYNHKLWVNASEGLKCQMLDAGRTSGGFWSVFREKDKEENAIDLT
ncbi:hypothetical protein B0H16DRAFT_1687100 [Mycena metata]|uniref:Uncharacterized protein n=1 Tax=Mycena metata TaxID=1033252 RepID=A0AAD7JKS5_9AGAR|nr:hypothetical protein B0H16DRAFT_1687100 [Mycena metata]